MELDEIASKLSNLNKWRKFFTCQGLEGNKAAEQKNQENHKSDDESENRKRAPPSAGIKKQVLLPSKILYAIPIALTVPASLGGQPISMEMAVHLRKILCGSTFQVFDYEWRKSYFKFREPYSDLSYALEVGKGGAKAVQMSVQAHILKYLLFTRNKDEDSSMKSLYEISQKEQEKALSAALTDILWTAGEGQKATVCLVSRNSHFTPTADYKADNFTERLLLFEILEKEAVQAFIYDHINCFNDKGSHGVILFLYSLIFSRTFERQGQGVNSATRRRGIRQQINRTVERAMFREQLSLFFREDILEGLVRRRYRQRGCKEWKRLKRTGREVGSMLKTPKLPIWLCNINGAYSVLFNTNRLLLSDWKVEHLFDLYFYIGQKSQNKAVRLTIDTHSHYWEGSQEVDESDIEKRFPSVEMAIRTKWGGAAINWNGTVPFF
ncbi:inactive ubiquitin carboxyl-terminal hydrolase MINDY-4B [Rhinatrema bivittatum]|uniref:inactive ubiquitin carboxyl-terminal hydrolase MINDY-4B n=1 Tax=Rhinatrema bivittatum TaxID=194408 RepID=UPI001125FA13|nr:inactive ubiquitin carboxyl-terminal hydrolase MINDY-4B [Rhinatrema bivittatum]